jgi:hypothetical protein
VCAEEGDPAQARGLVETEEKCEYEAFVTDLFTYGRGAEVTSNVEKKIFAMQGFVAT